MMVYKVYPAWSHGDAMRATDQLCIRWGVTRFKRHLAHQRGNVAAYPQVSKAIHKEMKTSQSRKAGKSYDREETNC